jgi:pimeloyl-ACP methyl ester carboxylesterase
MTTATMKDQGSILKVPGASLYYEVRGSGPVLLMIPGGPADAGVFASLASLLADRYTVVTYDPRGNSRSVPDGPPQDQNMDEHADDAAALLDAVGERPAFVLGSSGGAQIGLNLAARYPGHVATLVAHEPPCLLLLPDAAKQRAFMEELYEIYRRDGVAAAMQRFMTDTGLERAKGAEHKPQGPPPPEAQEMFGRIKGNFDFFLGHGLKPIGFFVPDFARLKSGPVRVVVAVGEETAGEVANRSALALAERLESAPVPFPGDHNGFGQQAAAFAAKLDQVLRG